MEPTPDNYATAERDWNEHKNVGFDELDSFEQYLLARTITEARKTRGGDTE